ncbi:MAG: hypothetical protein WC242_04475 [Candidatus Paceibacterota bacterium]
MIVTTKDKNGNRRFNEAVGVRDFYDLVVIGKLLLPLMAAKEIRGFKINETGIVFTYFLTSRTTGKDEALTIEIEGSAEEMADLGRAAVVQGMHPHGTWNPTQVDGQVVAWCNKVSGTQTPEENIKLGLILFCGYNSREEIDALTRLSITEINAAHRLVQSEGWAVMRVVEFCAA